MEDGNKLQLVIDADDVETLRSFGYPKRFYATRRCVVKIEKGSGLPTIFVDDSYVPEKDDLSFPLTADLKRVIVFRFPDSCMSMTVLLMHNNRALIAVHRGHFKFGYNTAMEAETAEGFVKQFFRRSLDMGPDVFDKTAATIPRFWEQLFAATFAGPISITGRIRTKYGGVETVPFTLRYSPGRGQRISVGDKAHAKWDMVTFPREPLYTALRLGAEKIISRKPTKKDQQHEQ